MDVKFITENSIHVNEFERKLHKLDVIRTSAAVNCDVELPFNVSLMNVYAIIIVFKCVFLTVIRYL